MKEVGFIKLYRSVLNWEWYDDINVKVLFLHLLLKANYEEKKWKGIDVKKGEFITSIGILAQETGLTQQEIKTCLTKLKKTGEITSRATNKFTLIRVEKWGFYQCIESESNHQTTNKQPSSNKQATIKQPSSNKQATTTKEYKEKEERKEREEKKNIYQLIADMYNATCVSLPRCTKLSETRERALRARLRRYTVEDFKRVFETAENTDFLKGANAKNWSANFDWLIKDSNMAKVLDGNYTHKEKTYQKEPAKGDNIFFEIGKEEGLF